jgi:dihydroorotase
MLLALILAMLLSSCAAWQKAKPFVRTINDAATTLCHLFASENEGKLGGLSPSDFCEVKENLDPFIDAALAAKQAAGAQAVSRGASQ